MDAGESRATLEISWLDASPGAETPAGACPDTQDRQHELRYDPGLRRIHGGTQPTTRATTDVRLPGHGRCQEENQDRADA